MSVHSPFEHDAHLDWELAQIEISGARPAYHQAIRVAVSGLAAIALIGIGLYNLFQPAADRSILNVAIGSLTLFTGGLALFAFILSAFATKIVRRKK